MVSSCRVSGSVLWRGHLVRAEGEQEVEKGLGFQRLGKGVREFKLRSGSVVGFEIGKVIVSGNSGAEIDCARLRSRQFARFLVRLRNR